MIPSDLKRFIRFPLLLVHLSHGACGADSLETHGIRRDSAGIAIVANAIHDPGTSGQWLVADLLVEIGQINGSGQYQFHEITGTIRFGETIAVANSGTRELMRYSVDGTHLTTNGGSGEGPGEFRTMGSMFRYRQDSILFEHNHSNRFSVFANEGHYSRSGRFQQDGVDLPFMTLEGSTADGDILVQTFQPGGFVFSEADGVVSMNTEVLRFDADGIIANSLGVFEGLSMYRGASPMAFGSIPFASTTHVVGFGGATVVGEGHSYQLNAYSDLARLQRIIRFDREPIMIGPGHKRENLERRRTEIDDLPTALRGPQEEILDEVPYPEFFPQFDRMLEDTEGNLWVRDYAIPGTPEQRYLVFDSSGALLGPVAMPLSFLPFDIGSDYVLGRHRGEFDVETVRLYRLSK